MDWKNPFRKGPKALDGPLADGHSADPGSSDASPLGDAIVANEAVKKLVKDKLASEDDQKRSEADIQKMTDKRIIEIDQLVAAKEQEIWLFEVHVSDRPPSPGPRIAAFFTG